MGWFNLSRATTVLFKLREFYKEDANLMRSEQIKL